MLFFALLGVHMTITRIKLKTEEQYMSFAQSWETRVNDVQWGFRNSNEPPPNTALEETENIHPFLKALKKPC